MSRKKTPPAYGDPPGPMMEETHSYRLSPFGPALQFVGGSSEISASSFWMRFAEELIEPFDIVTCENARALQTGMTCAREWCALECDVASRRAWGSLKSFLPRSSRGH